MGVSLQLSNEANQIARAKSLESTATLSGGGALHKLIDGLHDKSPLVRVAAAEGLAQLNRSQAIPHLVKVLADRNPEVRMRAAEAIGLITKSKHSPIELIEAVNDRDELVRVAVLTALGSIRDQKALPAVRKAISDKSTLVRRFACIALAKFGHSKDVDRLNRHLRTERSETAKLGYYYGLYLLGEKDQLYKMLTLLTSQDYRIRCSTANLLSELPTNKFQKRLVMEAIRERLHTEQTVAAKSSFRAALRRLTK